MSDNDEILNENYETTDISEGETQIKNEEETQINKEEKLEKEIEGLKKKCDEGILLYQRIAADFDNYKKRTAKERETTYVDALGETISTFLPVFDNFERAIKSIENIEENLSYKSGIEMLLKQFKESLEKLGVKEIDVTGKKFDPNFHNAVLHIEDAEYGEGEIVEELQKGFILREKVIRHSMVKVAN